MIPRIEIHFSLRQQKLFVLGRPYKPDSDEFLLDHSRSGILLALKALGLPQGDGVGVMVYNCHTVADAIEQSGCKPVFLDVTDELKLDMDDLGRKACRMSAIIVTHLFGIVNDIKRIKEVYPNLVIIEDCAHAYGMGEMYGDFATFSIGQGKLPSIGDGGILKVLNAKYLARIAELYVALPEYTIVQSALLFMNIWAKSLMQMRLFYGWMTLPLKKRRGSFSVKGSILPKKMCRGVSAVYAAQKGEIGLKIQERKENAQKLIPQLPEKFSHIMIGVNAFMLVVICDKPEQVQDYFYKQGVDTDTHFARFLDWVKQFGYVQGQCPKAEKLVSHLLMVPIYTTL